MKIIYLLVFLFPITLFGQQKVGINTQDPIGDLDVRGTDDTADGGELQLATPTMTNFLRFYGGRLGDPNPFIAFNSLDTFHLVTALSDWSNFTRRMSMLPNGFLGIGTDLPLSKLDIKATGDGAEILRFSTDRPWVFRQSGTGTGTKLNLQSTVDAKNFQILSENGLNRVASFFADNTHSRVNLVPDGGEVGIGVEDPLGKLHVSYNSTWLDPQLRITEEEDDYGRIKFESTQNENAYWDIAAKADTVTNDSKMNFYFFNNSNNGDRMTITGIGDVGIGKPSPEAKLDILGGYWNLDGGSPGDVRIGTSVSNSFRIGVATGGSGAGTVRMYSQGGSLFLGTNNTPHLAITTGGNIGIGDTDPGNKLRIVGHTTSTANVLSVSTAYAGNSNIRAIEGFSTPAIGHGIGGYFYGGVRGIQATAQGSSHTGTSIAVEASAYGTTGTRTGLFGRASGGTTNWAGYFAEGNVYITNELRIGSGASGGASGYKVAVDGKLIAEEVRVQLSQNWPDYVFSDDYPLLEIADVASYIKKEKHLPGIPSAKEIESSGLHLGEMQRTMVEKIEELMLYIIQQEERIQKLEQALQNK